jgi:murein DD-endopeptidase MepM/ murein hydrolase activator NlpD
MAVRLPGVLAALCIAAAVTAPLAGAASPRASATAFGVQITVPGGEGSTAAFSSAPPNGSGYAGSFSYPAGGNDALVAGPAATNVRTGPGSGARAFAEATVQNVRLFGGEIEIGRVALEASASGSGSGAEGSLSASTVEGLVVLGEPVAAAPNTKVALGDWGYAVVLEQAVLFEDGESEGYRGFVTGVHVYLTAEHAGLPAGSELLIGYAEAAARGSSPPAPPPSEEPSGGSNAGGSGGGGSGGGNSGGGGSSGGSQGGSNQLPSEPTTPAPGAVEPGPPPIVLDPPANVQPQITGQGYVFPVYGPASFTDDFNAARAITGWHHGNDIFASLGAPVLAVADGTLFSVGWNGVGGHRLWLRDRQGNEYYYAHLSAYSPAAFNGSQVRAGDVIGFVGDSGDAAGTPYHLHFEIHPRALLGLGYDGVVNPYRYLLAWYGRQDLTGAQGGSTGASALEPAAVVVQAEDIAAVSGLEPGGLLRAYALPLLIGGAASLVAPERPPLVGAEPGFAGL